MNDYSLFERIKQINKNQPFHLFNESQNQKVELKNLVLMPNQFAYSINCKNAELEEVIGNVKPLNLSKRDFKSIDIFYDLVYQRDVDAYIKSTIRNFEFMLGNRKRCLPLRNSFCLNYRLRKVNGGVRYIRRDTFVAESFNGIVTKTIGVISFMPSLDLCEVKPMVFGPDSIYFDAEPVIDFRSIVTNRELELIKLISQGFSNKQCAEELCISTRTVETHRKNILKKLEVNNTAHLVGLSKDIGLI